MVTYLCSNTSKCYRIQHELEVSTKQAIFVDSSISDTIRTCIVLGNHRAAMKVKTEFKVHKVPLLSIWPQAKKSSPIFYLAERISLGGT